MYLNSTMVKPLCKGKKSGFKGHIHQAMDTPGYGLFSQKKKKKRLKIKKKKILQLIIQSGFRRLYYLKAIKKDISLKTADQNLLSILVDAQLHGTTCSPYQGNKEDEQRMHEQDGKASLGHIFYRRNLHHSKLVCGAEVNCFYNFLIK